MSLGLAVGVFLARYLGPGQYGVYNFVLSVVALFSFIVVLGLDGVVVRELVKDPERKRDILGTAFILKFAGALIAICLIIPAILLIEEDNHVRYLILVASVAGLFQPFLVIDYYFQSKVSSKHVVICTLSQVLLSTAVKFVFISLEYPLDYFVYLYVGDAAFLAVFLSIVYRGKVESLCRFNFSYNMAKYLLSNSWPLMLASSAIVLYMKLDQVMIKSMLGSEALGFYSVAVRISEVWYFIPMAICTSLYPALVSSYSDKNEYISRLQQLYGFLILLATILVIVVLPSAKYIVPLLFGEEYLPAVSPLVVHIFALESLQIVTLWVTTFGLVMNILLNVVFIPVYGITGAAVATLFSRLVGSWLGYMCFKSTREASIMQAKSFYYACKLVLSHFKYKKRFEV
jgi:O-antigen/teichoic acid export membrane protein